ncbi:hypothetical protein XI00_06175 [Bradyrhizobium sp. CCBAU 21359]|nr:hypothetical protein [Bradyrhizobium sp. CCBAU 21359]
MNLVLFVPKQRMDAHRTLLASRAAKPLELSRIAQIRAQDLVVLGLETNQSVVRLRSLAMHAQQSRTSGRQSCLEAQSGTRGPSGPP